MSLLGAVALRKEVRALTESYIHLNKRAISHEYGGPTMRIKRPVAHSG